MRRKPARNLLDRVARQRANLRTSRARLANRLAARPTAPPCAARAYNLVLDHLDAGLATVESAVTATEDAYVAARERAAACRQQRDQATLHLREVYIPIQRLVGRLPVKGAAALAVAADSPADLAHQMPLAIDVLRALAREPPPKVLGVTIDAAVLAGVLEAALGPLDAALRAIDEGDFELQIARGRADAAFVPAQPVVKWVSQALTGLRGFAES